MTQSPKTDDASGLVEGFCAYLRQRGVTEATEKNYRSDVQRMLRWADSRERMDFSLHVFAARDLRAYREYLLSHLQPATVNRNLATARQFFEWALSVGLISETAVPNLEKVKQPVQAAPARRHLNAHEQRRLIDATQATGNAKDLAAILLMLGAGLRASEICNLRPQDLEADSDGVHLTIHRTKPARIARVTLPQQTGGALLALAAAQRKDGGRFLFGMSRNPITRRELEMLVQRCGREAEIPKLTPHALRHTFCLNMCATPLNPFIIAQFAGLNDVQVLRPYYDLLSKDRGIITALAVDGLPIDAIPDLGYSPSDLRDFFRRRLASRGTKLEASRKPPTSSKT